MSVIYHSQNLRKLVNLKRVFRKWLLLNELRRCAPPAHVDTGISSLSGYKISFINGVGGKKRSYLD